MGQARDEAGNIWETDAQGNAVRLLQAARAAPQMPADPTFPLQAPKVQSDINKTEADTAGRVLDNTVTAATMQPTVEKAEADAVKAKKEADEVDALGRLNALIKQINTVQGLFNSGPGATSGLEGLRDYGVSQEASAFDTAANSLEDIAIGAFKVPGMGAQSDADAARMAAAMKPSRWTFDAGTQQQLDDVRSRVDEWYKARNLPSPAWENLPVGIEGDVTDNTPDNMRLPEVGSWGDSLLSQGLSGYNEGIAALLGFPVDATTMALNTVPWAVNSIANTNIPAIDNPVLGSQWFEGALTDIGAIGPETSSSGNQFVRRAARSVGAASLPVAGAASTGGQVAAALLSSAAGGAGAATAQQVFPDNPTAEIIAELLGSAGGTGAALATARRNAQRTAEAAVPTVNQLKEDAGRLYEAGNVRGRAATQAETQDLADRFHDVSQDGGLISPTGRVSEAYPKTKEALNLANDYAQGTMEPKQMQTVRKVLSDAAQSPDAAEKRVATLLLREFDDFTAPMVPEFAEARGLYRRAMEGQKLEDLSRKADTRVSANSLRNEYANLERRDIDGRAMLSPAVSEVVDQLVSGTPATRALDIVGKAAPTGVVSGSLATGVPFMIGNAVGGPGAGAALSATSLGAGTVARLLRDKAVQQQARQAELVARNGGQIYVPPVVDDEVARILAAQAMGQISQY